MIWLTMKVAGETKGRFTTRIVIREMGITTHYLRRKEEDGLLNTGRSPGGYCLYSRADLAVIRRVLELKAKGFNLADISKILRNRFTSQGSSLENSNKN